jgi:hypothetical protein
MSVIESILKDLQSLSQAEQIEVARHVRGLSEAARKKRLSSLRQTRGALTKEDTQVLISEDTLVTFRSLSS